MAGPEISVIVPTFLRPERAERLLDAMARQTLRRDRFEVVLVEDHGSIGDVDRLRVAAERSPLRARVVQTASNGGPAVARNLGARVAVAPLLAFTDDDCVPDPGWLAALLDAFGAHPEIGVVQGRTVEPSDATIGHWTAWRRVVAPSPWFEGCNIAYRADALRASGGFDEAIGWYGEDTAAGWAVLAAGWRRSFAEDAVVVHDVEERGVGWHLRHGVLEANLVALAATYPGLRTEGFWRCWAFRRENAAFALAVVAAISSVRWRGALVALVPYLVLRRHLVHHPGGFRYGFETLAVDAAQTCGHAIGSARHRVVVL